MFEYNDPDDYFDVSNHEVDRQDDLEYEVRTLLDLHETITADCQAFVERLTETEGN